MRARFRRSIWRVYRGAGRAFAIAGPAGLLLASFAGLFAGGGCAAPAVRASGDPTDDAVPASVLVPLRAHASVREAIDPDSGDRIGLVRTVTTLDEGEPSGPGRWSVRTTESDPRGEVIETQSAGYERGPYGGVHLAWSRSVKDTDPDGPARLYVFEPPLIWFPGAIMPGMVFEDEARMTERDPADEKRVALSGRALRRVALVDQDSPGWPFEGPGRGVAAELRVRVGPAEAVRRSTVRIDERGNAGEEFIEYGVRVLGVPIRRERTLLRETVER